ncbi:SGNH/GDSL hydrolase family protein [Dermacoccaceae bacterium W4C1]
MTRRLALTTTALLAAGVAAAGTVTPAHAAADDYVALGDSYSAGTGTRAKVDDCYRSAYGYPALIAKSAGLDLNYQACSGATSSDLLAKQVGALSTGTSYVTLTIGGNDVGFTSILTECAKPGWLSDCEGAIAGGRKILTGSMPGRYANVYSTITSKAPNAKVVATGYPHIFNGEDCNAATFFSPEEEASLNSATTELNTLNRSKATAAGVTYVDAFSTFKGHAVCDDPEWLNGLSNPIEESYHPNRAGNAGYAGLLSPALTGKSASVRLPGAASIEPGRSAAQQARAQAGAVRSMKLSSPANLAKAKAAGLDPAEITRLDAQLGSGDAAVVSAALTRLRALDAQVADRG